VELEILINENNDNWTELQKQAAQEIMDSLKESIAKHETGEQNSRFTKANQYISIGNGLNINTTDNSIQLYGLTHTKVVLKPGEYKKVNSKPLTVEKNKIRRMLTVSKVREYALDLDNVGTVKVNGQSIELEPTNELIAEYVYEVNPTSTQFTNSLKIT
jgi:hypothetical protein